RRLAGPVLAEDGVNTPAVDCELRLLQRLHAAVALGDADHPKERTAAFHSVLRCETARDRAPRAVNRSRRRLLVSFRLPHDFLRREIDAAGGEVVADEEVVRLIGVVVLAVLEAGVLRSRERQAYRLRNHLALKRGY